MDDTDGVDDTTRQIGELDFHHPYTPYDVQEQFMRAVYGVLDVGGGQVGILESPTGTGKSLSLICASLTWLRNYKSTSHEAALRDAGEAYKDEPQWLIDQLLRRKRDELVRRWEDREKRLEDIRLKERAREDRASKRRRIDERQASGAGRQSRLGPRDALSGLSKESREVLERMGLGAPKKRDEDDDVLEEEIKIYYTSRTHSQLSQFITELRRPSFPPSLPSSVAKDQQNASEAVKLLPLSSRQRLCINPSVSRLGSVQAINDRCAELQQNKGGKKCDYVPREELLSQTHQFRDTALATLPDIEDLHQLGKSLAVCPYYASRAALPGAEIITLPYPLLLQKSARDALGIKLEGNVVIIDEAHNIMDAVANVHAAELKLSDLRKGRGMLGVYVKRFGKKLKGENRVNSFKQEHGIVDPNDLTRRKGIDQINMYELIQYIQESKLAYKIEGYAAHVEAQEDGGKATLSKASSPVLHSLVSFLVALTNPSSEGRIFYQKAGGDVQLSYLLLSPTHAFSSIASSARAVILAGGTMSPFDDYRNHLFPTLAAPKVTTLSCGHVIPRENLCVRVLAGTRPGGAPFEFSFQRRGDKALMEQLGLAVLNITQADDGDKHKPRAATGRGALLLSVVGGKMSEGINFSDRLGRCVVVVGLPYPNAASPEWKAKMEYIETTTLAALMASSDSTGTAEATTTTTHSDGQGRRQALSREEATLRAKAAARDFYENACMRAVNQSIGRAIRHRGDYAAIVLADRRYGTERIRAKLPGWIREGMGAAGASTDSEMLGALMGGLSVFFRGKAAGPA
ncbi:hypothetical protein ACCO45_012405 [Purpureocillium lilacinum]|uniref:Uncharacterized protein n=1 Tax=Purpureocillium lilacinum TaxID=33203 RepID=A0ACC4D829_PURLI